jgi:tRNA A-37 threonylcarbamoyl transferase component Bud32
VELDDELIGRTVGSYQVVKVLGKGGMGAVYMAEHPVIGSRVAIKFLHPQYATDRKIVDRFFNEARAVNVIGHDNILKILDLDVTEDNRHYFVMEFLNGKPLQDLVVPDIPVPLQAGGPILLQVCEALQAAHDHGIIHRDLKPDNVYLTVHKGKKNFVKVVDFGIARVTDDKGASTGKTQTGMVMGTPAYMSPEQAGGMTARIDARSDIYSLGCMMFQMATGKLPGPQLRRGPGRASPAPSAAPARHRSRHARSLRGGGPEVPGEEAGEPVSEHARIGGRDRAGDGTVGDLPRASARERGGDRGRLRPQDQVDSRARLQDAGPRAEVLDPEKDTRHAGPSADDGGDATASAPAETAHRPVGRGRRGCHRSGWRDHPLRVAAVEREPQGRGAGRVPRRTANRRAGEAGGAARRGGAEAAGE